MRKIITFILSSILLITSITPALAVSPDYKAVLGISDSTAPNIPPTSQGPGIFTPDSPFFFLDELKQNIRLAFALTPQAKAKVHADIAGERLAELRIELAKNNSAGIQTDLNGISDNLKAASDNVAQAQLSGQNVTDLAKTINSVIKEQQSTLDILQAQSGVELKTQVQATTASLTVAKVKAEDALPPADLQNEIRDDITRQVLLDASEASSSAVSLRQSIDVLEEQASEAAKESLGNREDALKKAIEIQSEQLKKQTEAEDEAEQSKNQAILQLESDAAKEAEKIVESAQKTSSDIQQSNTIQITSNKTIICTGPDGKQFSTTQDACNNFLKAWGKSVNGSSGSSGGSRSVSSSHSGSSGSGGSGGGSGSNGGGSSSGSGSSGGDNGGSGGGHGGDDH